MAKKIVSRQSVIKSAKRREQERKEARRRRITYLIIAVIAVAFFASMYVLLVGGQEVEEERPLAEISPADRNGYFSEYPPMVIDEDKDYEAIIQTDKGSMRLTLFNDLAPKTVNNFVFLARQGFYDGTIFHRVIRDFMAQGGDPTGHGTGGPGYTFEDETDNGLVFDRPGLLAMANRGPNTNGSQFFITYGIPSHLNGVHTIFGELVAGEDVLNSLTPTDAGGEDSINSITIVEK